MIEEKRKKILVVEDDPNLGYVIKDNLVLKGYEVILATDGSAAEDIFNANGFDLCIFDVMLPRKDGFTLAKEIRQKDDQVPILFLTAKSMVEDKLAGFQSGGDDFITKPFSLDELICRIEVFLKRSNGAAKADDEGIFTLGKFRFDPLRLTLKNHSSEKTLTQKEADVLKLLYRNRDRVLKREEILKSIWGDDDYFMGRSMDVFISKLRKYLRDDPDVQIVNYHGVGFRLEVR